MKAGASSFDIVINWRWRVVIEHRAMHILALDLEFYQYGF